MPPAHPCPSPRPARPPRTRAQSEARADSAGKEHVIDAMRGFAALLVAYFHCRQVEWVGMQAFHQSVGHAFSLSTIAAYLTFPIAWGSAGVPIFFVISGYCIHRGGALRLASNPAYRLDTGQFLGAPLRAHLSGAARGAAADFRARLVQPAFAAGQPQDPRDRPACVPRQPVFAARRGRQDVWIERRALDAVARSAVLRDLSAAVRAAPAHRHDVRAGDRRGRQCGVRATCSSATIIQFFTSYWFSWTLGAWIADAQSPHARRRRARRCGSSAGRGRSSRSAARRSISASTARSSCGRSASRSTCTRRWSAPSGARRDTLRRCACCRASATSASRCT